MINDDQTDDEHICIYTRNGTILKERSENVKKCLKKIITNIENNIFRYWINLIKHMDFMKHGRRSGVTYKKLIKVKSQVYRYVFALGRILL